MDFSEPQYCTGFWLVCFMGSAGWGCVNQKPQAAKFHQANGEIKTQSSRVQNQLSMAGVHSALGGGVGWGCSWCHRRTDSIRQQRSRNLLHGNLSDGVLSGIEPLKSTTGNGSYLLFSPIYCYRWWSCLNLEGPALSSLVLLSWAFKILC